MARNREKKHPSLVYQVEMKLKSKLAIGHSKYNDQREERRILNEKRKIDSKATLNYSERITIHKIYTWSTFQNYQKHACYFVKWCKEQYGCRELSVCRQYVNEWLSKRSGLSAYTQKLEASALANIFDCTTEDFIKTEIRHRSNITRSRNAANRDKNFSETKNKEFTLFCKATGLRKE